MEGSYGGRDGFPCSLTGLALGRNSMRGRWLYTRKEGSDGTKAYEARYVAKGYSQQKGIDYQETFAPTANLTSLRVLLQMQPSITNGEQTGHVAYMGGWQHCCNK